jgi:hypothetical protein
MATKPTTVPGWVPVGTTPSAGQKTTGFATNGPLPAGWANWFWTLVSTWVAYLRDGVIVGEAGEPGLTVTGGSGNEIGIVVAGTGTAASLQVNSSPSAPAELVTVDASTSGGTGIHILSNSTRAPLWLGAIAGDPSTLSDGMLWYNSSTNKFRGRAGGASVDLH